MPPWVQVWLSPQTTSAAGQAHAELGPDDMDDALAGFTDDRTGGRPARGVSGAQIVQQAQPTGLVPARPGALEMAWSGVAKVRPGLRSR